MASAALVPGIKEIVDNGILSVPHSFVRPPHERPCASQLVSDSFDQIPVVDFSGLLSPERRLQTLREIGHACEEWGFFQVVNHGVPGDVVDGMKAACHGFFRQPAAERNRYRSQDFDAGVAYFTSFNPSVERTRDWKDVLYVRDLPGKCNGFPEAPQICKTPFQDYRRSVQKLANSLYQAIFESLGLSSRYLETALTGITRLIMAVNYYPACPDPSLTFGLSGHSDVSSLTVLLQDEVPGLQIRKEGKWAAVKPIPNAFVINLGDQIQLLTNGIYKSAEHRVLTNAQKDRLSVACFFGPTEDTKIAPLSKLISENCPAMYREVVFGDYVKNFYSRELQADKASLDFAKLSAG